MIICLKWVTMVLYLGQNPTRNPRVKDGVKLVKSIITELQGVYKIQHIHAFMVD